MLFAQQISIKHPANIQPLPAKVKLCIHFTKHTINCIHISCTHRNTCTPSYNTRVHACVFQHICRVIIHVSSPGAGVRYRSSAVQPHHHPLPSMRTRVNTHAHTRILLHWYSPTTRIYVGVSILIRDTHGPGHIRGDDHSRRKLNLIQVKLILEQVGSFVRCDSRHRTWCNHEGYTTPHPLVPFSVHQNRKFFFLKYVAGNWDTRSVSQTDASLPHRRLCPSDKGGHA